MSKALQPYHQFASDIQQLLSEARRQAARSVNAILTATYWEVGRRIVEFEQKGHRRADYGEELLERLATDLTRRIGRGFSYPNLKRFRQFYLLNPAKNIRSTLSSQFRKSRKVQPQSAQSSGDYLAALADVFPLSWSHYVRLLSVENSNSRSFYEAEALRGGWSVRQLDRQIQSLFYERTALSREKAAMLTKGARPQPGDALTPEEELKDPFVLEFLGLKDRYSESDIEEALIRYLESFLLELGGDFAFVGRQRRLRIGDDWYRVDLLFFHRRLRCLVVIDLKVGKFTHADAGQMHLYLNYAREHWTQPGENPPVGLILCAEKNAAVAHYALEGLPNKVLAAQYRTTLPDERQLTAELERTRRALETREPPRRRASGRPRISK